MTRLSSVAARFRELSPGVLFSLLAVYFIWGSTYLALRIGLVSFPPFLLIGSRFVVAGGLMFAYLRWRGAPLPTPRQWRDAAVIALLLLGVGNGGVVVAEQWVSSSLAAAVVATSPLWAAMFAGFTGHWPSRWEWLGIGLGLTGVILLNLEGELRASPLGAVLLVMAPIGWALGSVLSRRLDLPPGVMGTAAEMLAGGPLLIAFGLLTGERLPAVYAPEAVLAWLYLIVFGSIVAFSAYMFLIRAVRPALAMSYAYVNPVVALGLGLLFADGAITGTGLAGIAVILVGVMFITLRPVRS